ESHETLASKAVAHVFDVVDQPPPLLDHDDSRSGAAVGHRQISGVGRTVARKLDHGSHSREVSRCPCRPDGKPLIWRENRAMPPSRLPGTLRVLLAASFVSSI